MLQAALSDRLFLDLCPCPENGFVATEVDVCGCDVVQTLVVTLFIVVIDEGPDLTLKIARQGNAQHDPERGISLMSVVLSVNSLAAVRSATHSFRDMGKSW